MSHRYSELEEEITNLVWFFEGVERLRANCNRKLTHLAKRRLCHCGHYYYPRVAKTRCPECEGKLRSKKGVMTCPKCGYVAGELGCPWCRGKENWKAAPKDHTYIKQNILPALVTLEANAEETVAGLVCQHPLWDWASQVKGIGPTTVARMISACEIERCTTLSKFFAHYGWGLRADGTTQRKIKGEKIGYDKRAQSIAYMMARNLETQTGERAVKDKNTGEKRIVQYEPGRYYEFYQDWKQENLARGLSDGQGTSRAFRNMLQLALSHFYEVWRKGDNLTFAEPYPYTILRPPHALDTKITPEEVKNRVNMVEKEAS